MVNAEHFVLADLGQANEQVTFWGVPFVVTRRDGLIQPLPYEAGGLHAPPGAGIPLDATCTALFFLGMTTEQPAGSEWWGPNERYHYQGQRLFLDDRLGTLGIHYADDTIDPIPLLFGVNVWPYELFTPVQPHERERLQTFGGPYAEPFASDADARQRLAASLLLQENEVAEKGLKYMFGVRVAPKPLRRVLLLKAEYRTAGFAVSAVTGLRAEAPVDPAWRLTAPEDFVRKRYFPALDHLARRLYQFEDALPQHVPLAVPAGYAGPLVRFAGNGLADIFTNVYLANWHDMATRKLDADGRSHTSSGNLPMFGSYVGFGTFAASAQAYYKDMWSRDVGRELMELVRTGERARTALAAEVQIQYLYAPDDRYPQPHWHRISNAFELGQADLMAINPGKENDGHAAMMLFYVTAFACGIIDMAWLRAHRQFLTDAVDWFRWQIATPDLSHFAGVLHSESEASMQIYGGYDLFSNAFAVAALRGFVRLAEAMSDQALQQSCAEAAATLQAGIMERFVGEHPRYGSIFTDTTEDCWTWEYKAFAPLFLLADTASYDPVRSDPDTTRLAHNTYHAQRESAEFSLRAGRQMGYGLGYLTQAALLLDEYADFTALVEQAAKFCYHHTDAPYIVPEGVICHPSGRFWFRNSDLGNAVQQGEILKCARLLIGLDDLDATGLNLIPRLPLNWTGLRVEHYPVIVTTTAGRTAVPVEFAYERIPGGYRLALTSPVALPIRRVRLGPFAASGGDLRADSSVQSTIEQQGAWTFWRAEIGERFTQFTITVTQADA